MTDGEFSQRLQQVEALVQEIERAPDQRMRASAQDLVRALLDLHKAGLQRVLHTIGRQDGGPRIVDELVADDLVSKVLELHDLHPVPLDARVRRAMDAVEARAARHGAHITVLQNRDGAVRIRIEAGSGCGSTTDAIQQMVEEALYEAAPDLIGVEFETAAPPPAQTFVSLQQLKTRRVDPIDPGGLHGRQV